MIRIFKVFVPNRILFLLLSEAVLIFGCYLGATYILYPLDATSFLFIDDGFVRISIGTAIILLGLYFNDLYDNLQNARLMLINQLCVTIGMALLIEAVIAYVNRAWMMPRSLMMLGSAFVGIIIFNWRLLYLGALSKAIRTRSILFVGCSPVAVDVARQLQSRPEIGLTVAGYLADDCSSDHIQPSSFPRLGCITDFSSVMKSVRPANVVIAMEERRNRLPVNQLLDLRFSGIHIEDVGQLYEAVFGRVCARELRPSSLIFSSELGVRPPLLHLQSLYSRLIAAIAAIVTLPIMAIVAVLVKMTSKGPVLFRQARVGMHDIPFVVYKFRSMYEDAEHGIGPVWATKNDPRITPVGRWLRRLRLDELPQLFNVLRGEMSICGPRPERPEFVKTLSQEIPFYRQRHCVRPGITGWAQINYKYGDTIEDTVVKLEFDLYYIKNLSPALDAYIIFHTMKTMLLSRGSQ